MPRLEVIPVRLDLSICLKSHKNGVTADLGFPKDLIFPCCPACSRGIPMFLDTVDLSIGGRHTLCEDLYREG